MSDDDAITEVSLGTVSRLMRLPDTEVLVGKPCGAGLGVPPGWHMKHRIVVVSRTRIGQPYSRPAKIRRKM